MTKAKANRSAARSKREESAANEAEWFYGELCGRVPAEGTVAPRVRDAALAIDVSLRALPAFHRGALSLAHTKREWPPCIQEQFPFGAALVIRLECALHPAVGRSTAELERASVERLTERIAEAERDKSNAAEVELARLLRHAARHFRLAIRALARERGDAPCRVPSATHRREGT